MLEPRRTQPFYYLQTKPSNVLREFSARTHNLLLIISLAGGVVGLMKCHLWNVSPKISKFLTQSDPKKGLLVIKRSSQEEILSWRE